MEGKNKKRAGSGGVVLGGVGGFGKVGTTSFILVSVYFPYSLTHDYHDMSLVQHVLVS